MTNRQWIFAKDVLDVIDQSLYNNGDPVGAASNLPTITILHWDNIRLQDQILIQNKFNAKDWLELI
jgi:hypothetical protein